MFAAGNFSAPMLIHAQNPPGTEEMKRLREAIQYRLQTTEKTSASSYHREGPGDASGRVSIPPLPDFRPPNRRFSRSDESAVALAGDL